jgi:hypothetical protein
VLVDIKNKLTNTCVIISTIIIMRIVVIIISIVVVILIVMVCPIDAFWLKNTSIV